MNNGITIIDFDARYQPGVDQLLAGIQNEFAERIYAPDAKKMEELAQMPGRKYWVAIDNNKVIGSVGIVLLNDNNAALKSMMLQKEYRGKEKQVADTLLEIVLAHAQQVGTTTMYLGTMIQFKAAQYFYIKHGFTEIGTNELPADFISNPVDKVFFKLRMA